MLHLNCLILFLRSNSVTLSHILEEVFLLFCFAFLLLVLLFLYCFTDCLPSLSFNFFILISLLCFKSYWTMTNSEKIGVEYSMINFKEYTI